MVQHGGPNGTDMDTAIKRIEAEVAELTAAIEADPDDVAALNKRGVLFGQLVKAGDAVEDFNNALQIDPGNAEAYYNRAMAYIHLRQLSLAIEDFTKAFELDPTNTDALANRGMANYEAKHPDLAVRDAELALAVNAKHPQAYAVRALGRAFLGQEEPALDDLASAVSFGFDSHTLGMLIKQARLAGRRRAGE
jgi:tetratricopeptide (TPR) repeat protein